MHWVILPWPAVPGMMVLHVATWNKQRTCRLIYWYYTGRCVIIPVQCMTDRVMEYGVSDENLCIYRCRKEFCRHELFVILITIMKKHSICIAKAYDQSSTFCHSQRSSTCLSFLQYKATIISHQSNQPKSILHNQSVSDIHASPSAKL